MARHQREGPGIPPHVRLVGSVPLPTIKFLFEFNYNLSEQIANDFTFKHDQRASGSSHVPYELVPFTCFSMQLPKIMNLIKNELSEPYSIYCHYYFHRNHPECTFLVRYTSSESQVHRAFRETYLDSSTMRPTSSSAANEQLLCEEYLKCLSPNQDDVYVGVIVAKIGHSKIGYQNDDTEFPTLTDQIDAAEARTKNLRDRFYSLWDAFETTKATYSLTELHSGLCHTFSDYLDTLERTYTLRNKAYYDTSLYTYMNPAQFNDFYESNLENLEKLSLTIPISTNQLCQRQAQITRPTFIHHFASQGYVAMLAVHKDHRKRHLAQALVDFCIKSLILVNRARVNYMEGYEPIKPLVFEDYLGLVPCTPMPSGQLLTLIPLAIRNMHACKPSLDNRENPLNTFTLSGYLTGQITQDNVEGADIFQPVRHALSISPNNKTLLSVLSHLKYTFNQKRFSLAEPFGYTSYYSMKEYHMSYIKEIVLEALAANEPALNLYQNIRLQYGFYFIREKYLPNYYSGLKGSNEAYRLKLYL